MKHTRDQAMTDEELFAGYQRGSDAMLEQLIRRYEQNLYGFLMKVTGNPTAAGELFQDTWVQVTAKQDLYRRGRAFKPWLYQVGLNLARDRFRREGLPYDAICDLVGRPLNTVKSDLRRAILKLRTLLREEDRR